MSGELISIFHSRLTPDEAAAVLQLSMRSDEALLNVYFQYSDDTGTRFGPDIAKTLLGVLRRLAQQSMDGKTAVALVAK